MLHFELEHAIAFSNATGIKVAFIPLHRGSDGFMSLAQFEKFYWPHVEGHAGDWSKRHHAVCLLRRRVGSALEVPGRTAQRQDCGLFQFSDIFKVKEVVGETMCHHGWHAQLAAASGHA